MQVQKQLCPCGLLLDLQQRQGNCVFFKLLFGQTAIGTVLGLKFVSVSVSYVCSTWPAPQVVVGGRRISVSSSETQSSVEVSQACVTDTGSYTLVVRNRKGSAQHTVSLSVIGEAVQSHSDLRQHYNPHSSSVVADMQIPLTKK